jgi:hypothetical protein
MSSSLSFELYTRSNKIVLSITVGDRVVTVTVVVVAAATAVIIFSAAALTVVVVIVVVMIVRSRCGS